MSIVVALAVGASVLVLVAVFVPIGRGARTEGRLDPEEAVRALLGEDPPGFPEPEPSADCHRDYDPGELRALRSIGAPKGRRAKRR